MTDPRYHFRAPQDFEYATAAEVFHVALECMELAEGRPMTEADRVLFANCVTCLRARLHVRDKQP